MLDERSVTSPEIKAWMQKKGKKEKDVCPARVGEILKTVGDCNEDGSTGDIDPHALATQLGMMRQCGSISQPAASLTDIIMEQDS